MEDQELQAFEVAGFISQKLNGNLTAIDAQRLETWKQQSDANLQLYNELLNETAREGALKQMGRYDAKAALDRINKRIEIPVISLRTKKLWSRIAVAASLVVITSVGLLIYRHNAAKQPQQFTTTDVPPGSNKAVLTLSDGRKINIDDHSNGAVAQQAGVRISKTDKGELVYSTTQSNVTLDGFNTITTPNGGQYQVVLPDGTHVWLNAASSLRYPTQFYGRERKVTLTGEGYFEVAHNAAMPFIVDCGNQSVRVLGTHFNVHNYADEPVVTTLLEGSVNVTASAIASQVVLKPGQQAVHNDSKLNVTTANIDEALAWKNGQFIFYNTSLTTVMRQAQRWYDVQVDFSTLPNEQYNGVISRNVPLSRLLEMLEATSSIKFKIKERRIMIQK